MALSLLSVQQEELALSLLSSDSVKQEVMHLSLLSVTVCKTVPDPSLLSVNLDPAL